MKGILLPPLFTGKLQIKFQNILRNTTQVIAWHRICLQMDGHGETSIPPYNFVAGGIIKSMKNSWKHLHPFLNGQFLTWSDRVLQLKTCTWTFVKMPPMMTMDTKWWQYFSMPFGSGEQRMGQVKVKKKIKDKIK